MRWDKRRNACARSCFLRILKFQLEDDGFVPVHCVINDLFLHDNKKVE